MKQNGFVSQEVAIMSFLVLVIPFLAMLVLPLVVAYGDMIVSIRQQWRESNTRRAKIAFIVVYGAIAMLFIYGLTSITLDYVQ